MAIQNRRHRRLPVGAALGRVLADRFGRDPLDLADVLGVLVRRADLRPRTLILLPRTMRGGPAVAILPRVTDPTTTSGMLAVACALHLDSAVGEAPLAFADGDPLLDTSRARRARRFARAFLGVPAEASDGRRIA